jgi:hypothetical protein
MKRPKTARDNILICTCKTEPRAQELEKLLNGEGYVIGVTAQEDKVFLHQAEAERPYGVQRIKQIKAFAQAWNRLVNAISV